MIPYIVIENQKSLAIVRGTSLFFEGERKRAIAFSCILEMKSSTFLMFSDTNSFEMSYSDESHRLLSI